MHPNKVELLASGNVETLAEPPIGADKWKVEQLILRLTLQLTSEEAKAARWWQQRNPDRLLEEISGQWEGESPFFSGQEPCVLLVDYDPMGGVSPQHATRFAIYQLLQNLTYPPRGHHYLTRHMLSPTP